MSKIAVLLLTAIGLAGCVFDSSGIAVGDGWFIDVGTDGGLKDDTADSTKSDGKKPDTLLPDTLQSDVLKPDGKPPPDQLLPDIDLCKGVNCNYGSCVPSTGKCNCNTGFDGNYCNQCALGYGPFPTCSPLQPSVSVNIKCSSPCTSGSTVDVDVTHTNAVSCDVYVECVVPGDCTVQPSKKGKIYIPPSTAQATHHTFKPTSNGTTVVKWILGSPAPADVRFQAVCGGVQTPPVQAYDNKSIALH